MERSVGQFGFYEKGLIEGHAGNLLNLALNARTLGMLKSTSKEDFYRYLSGLLVGTELKSISNKTKFIHLISKGSLIGIYKMALKVLGFSAELKFSDPNQAFINRHIRRYKGF